MPEFGVLCMVEVDAPPAELCELCVGDAGVGNGLMGCGSAVAVGRPPLWCWLVCWCCTGGAEKDPECWSPMSAVSPYLVCPGGVEGMLLTL